MFARRILLLAELVITMTGDISPGYGADCVILDGVIVLEMNPL